MATCVRVPVMRAHAESITVELEKEISEDAAREIIGAFPGVGIIDDRGGNRCVGAIGARGWIWVVLHRGGGCREDC